jgi:hypothetical protein
MHRVSKGVGWSKGAGARSLALPLLLSGAIGCGSSQGEPPAPASAPPPLLNGHYQSATGPYTDVTFVNGRYSAVRASCTGGVDACSEAGTYALDETRDQLTLTRTTGQTTTTPFSAVDDASLHTQSLLAGQSTLLCAGAGRQAARLIGSLLLWSSTYTGGDCPPPSLSADECQSSCLYPSSCQRDPSDTARYVCADPCGSACSKPQSCLPPNGDLSADPSATKWSCQFDYCGGSCSSPRVCHADKSDVHPPTFFCCAPGAKLCDAEPAPTQLSCRGAGDSDSSSTAAPCCEGLAPDRYGHCL